MISGHEKAQAGNADQNALKKDVRRGLENSCE